MENIITALKTKLSAATSNLGKSFNSLQQPKQTATGFVNNKINQITSNLDTGFKSFIQAPIENKISTVQGILSQITPGMYGNKQLTKFNQDYTKNYVSKPVIEGITTIKKPGIINKAVGSLQVGSGVVSALPGTIPFNLAIGGLAGAIRASRNKTDLSKGIYQGLTQPEFGSIASSMGIENPYAALGLDLIINHKLANVPVKIGKAFSNLNTATNTLDDLTPTERLKTLLLYEDRLAKWGYNKTDRAKITAAEAKKILSKDPEFLLADGKKAFGGFNLGEWLQKKIEGIKLEKPKDVLESLKLHRNALDVSKVNAFNLNLGFRNRVGSLQIDPNTEWKLVQWSELTGNEAQQFAKRVGLTDELIQRAKPLIDEHRKFNTKIRDLAIQEGFATNYIRNHILHSFKEPQETVDDVITKTLSSRPGFTKKRTTAPYAYIGDKLTPLYTTFGQLNARALEQFQKAIADKQLKNFLVKNAVIVPANTAPKGFIPVFSDRLSAAGDIPYYASPENANLINRVFGDNNQSVISKGLEVAGNVSGKIQDTVLTGGLRTINSFTIGQTFRDFATALGDMVTGHPIRGAKTASAPITALMRDFIPGMSDDFEKLNIKSIKELAANGHGYGGNLSYQTLQKNVTDKASLEKALETGQNLFDQISNTPTFKHFLFQRKVSLYNNWRDSLVSQGKTYEEAVKIASQQLKSYDGAVDTLGRDKDISNLLKTFFLAPQYRESLINAGTNIVKGFTNQIGNSDYEQSRRLGIGIVLTYVIYNGLQKQLTGGYMWNNPPGRELELVIPKEDGKTYYSIPFMPSSTAIYRRAFGTLAALIRGDGTEASRQFSSLFSIPVSKTAELITNKDYFGRDVITEDAPVIPQLGLWGIKSFSPGYVREGIQYAQDKNKYDKAVAEGKKATEPSIAISLLRAFEFPLKEGSYASQYFTVRDDLIKYLNKEEKQIFQTLQEEGSNDTRESMTKASLRLQYPRVAAIETAIAKQTAEKLNQKVDPFYLLPPSYQRVALTYTTLPPGNADRTALLKNNGWLKEYWNARSTFFNEQGLSNNDDSGRPQITADLQQKLEVYNSLPSGTGDRTRFINANPEIKQFFDASRAFTNTQRQELGLPELPTFNYSKRPKKIKLAKLKVKKIKGLKAKRLKIKAPKLKKIAAIKVPQLKVKNIYG